MSFRYDYERNNSVKPNIIGIKLGHMKNELVCVLYIAIVKTPTCALFLWPSFTPVNTTVDTVI